jgi:hypothetical protein
MFVGGRINRSVEHRSGFDTCRRPMEETLGYLRLELNPTNAMLPSMPCCEYRNSQHPVTLLEELQALGIALVSLVEGIDDPRWSPRRISARGRGVNSCGSQVSAPAVDMM